MAFLVMIHQLSDIVIQIQLFVEPDLAILIKIFVSESVQDRLHSVILVLEMTVF